MGLFNGKAINPKKHIVLSASRMTDMPRFYPEAIINRTKERIEAGQSIHTLVLWTKHPASLFKEPLFSFLSELKKCYVQLFVQLTITGMGGKVFGKTYNSSPLIIEPCVPSWEESIDLLPNVVSLVEKPQRVCLRIDPLLRFSDASGTDYSNYECFYPIAKASANEGVRNIVFSFVEDGVYKKVNKRFDNAGCRVLSPTLEDRKKITSRLENIAVDLHVKISACNVEGFPDSKCIDGILLEQLHDEGFTTILKQPRSREKCGCTHSIDIGGWPPASCDSGCLYCYSNPRFQ